MDEQAKIELLLSYQDKVIDNGVDIPKWIDPKIRVDQVGELILGGDCVTYMGAADHAKALETMTEYGSMVLDCIQENEGAIPAPSPDHSGTWGQMATFYLSLALKYWARSVLDTIAEDIENF